MGLGGGEVTRGEHNHFSASRMRGGEGIRASPEIPVHERVSKKGGVTGPRPKTKKKRCGTASGGGFEHVQRLGDGNKSAKSEKGHGLPTVMGKKNLVTSSDGIRGGEAKVMGGLWNHSR